MAPGLNPNSTLIDSAPLSASSASLRPALGGLIPARRDARRLGSQADRRRRNPYGLLRSTCSRRRGFRDIGQNFFLFGEQRGDQSESLHFLLQAGQFHFFLP